MNQVEVKNQIAILKSPKFWNIKTKQANSRANFVEGDVQWDFCIIMNAKYIILKTLVILNVIITNFVNYL